MYTLKHLAVIARSEIALMPATKQSQKLLHRLLFLGLFRHRFATARNDESGIIAVQMKSRRVYKIGFFRQGCMQGGRRAGRIFSERPRCLVSLLFT
jgi:hypothetical protein